MVETLDSGKRQIFETGAQRDTNEKPDFSRIPLWLLNVLQFVFTHKWYRPNKKNNPIIGYEKISETRHDLIPDLALNRLGGLYHRGALKYSDNNWKKGIPLARYFASALRHLLAWAFGDTSEDHLAAVAWNVFSIMWTEREIALGRLPKKYGNAGPLTDNDTTPS